MNRISPEWRVYRSPLQSQTHDWDDGYWKASVGKAPVGYVAIIRCYDGPEQGREFSIERETLDEAKAAAVAKIARQRT